MKTEKSSVIKETDDVMPGEFERYLFHEGTLYKSYRMLGAHITAHQKQRGVRFAVWAPNALQVNVVGDFNNWKGRMIHSNGWMLPVFGLVLSRILKKEIYINTKFIHLQGILFKKQIRMRLHRKHVQILHQLFTSWEAMNGRM